MVYTISTLICILSGTFLIILAINTIRKDRREWRSVLFQFLMSIFFFFLVYPIKIIEEREEHSPPTEMETTVAITNNESKQAVPSTIFTVADTTIVAYTETNNFSNEVVKDLSFVDASYSVQFKAPISGKYRFEFLTNDVQTNYSVYLENSKNEKVINSEYDTFSHGKTSELEKNEVYTLTISQKEGFPTATVIIHVPSEKAVLSFDEQEIL